MAFISFRNFPGKTHFKIWPQTSNYKENTYQSIKTKVHTNGTTNRERFMFLGGKKSCSLYVILTKLTIKSFCASKSAYELYLAQEPFTFLHPKGILKMQPNVILWLQLGRSCYELLQQRTKFKCATKVWMLTPLTLTKSPCTLKCLQPPIWNIFL